MEIDYPDTTTFSVQHVPVQHFTVPDFTVQPFLYNISCTAVYCIEFPIHLTVQQLFVQLSFNSILLDSIPLSFCCTAVSCAEFFYIPTLLAAETQRDRPRSRGRAPNRRLTWCVFVEREVDFFLIGKRKSLHNFFSVQNAPVHRFTVQHVTVQHLLYSISVTAFGCTFYCTAAVQHYFAYRQVATTLHSDRMSFK